MPRKGSPYGRDWQRLRAAFLVEHPLCKHCQQRGVIVAAEEVHHVEPVEKRPDLRLDAMNLIGLCKPCHSVETAREKTGRSTGVRGCDAAGRPLDPAHPWNAR